MMFHHSSPLRRIAIPQHVAACKCHHLFAVRRELQIHKSYGRILPRHLQLVERVGKQRRLIHRKYTTKCTRSSSTQQRKLCQQLCIIHFNAYHVSFETL